MSPPRAHRLVAYCSRSTDAHARRALEAARLVRADVDSPMESRLRMLLVLAGLPEPEVDLRIRNDLGDVLARFDLACRSARVAVEYDGRQHAESPKQHDRDIDRREDIDSWQWRIIVITAKGISQEPERTLARVAGVLRERGCPGLPRRSDDRWRPHFPAQATARRDR
jgi:very-short-patch-repair endonuclease